MASISFKDLEITLNGVHLLTDSAIISQDSNPSPGNLIGYNKPITYPNAGLKTSLLISYITENNDPSFVAASAMKLSQTSVSPIPIFMGGLTGNFYLESFKLSCLPNEPVKTLANYLCFTQLPQSTLGVLLTQGGDYFALNSTGDQLILGLGAFGGFETQSSQALTGYNLLNGSGIIHYWSCNAVSDTNTGSLLQFAYNLRAGIEPTYIIGSNEPSQVNLLSLQEEFDLMMEAADVLKYGPQDAPNYFGNFDKILLNNISSLWGAIKYTLTLPLSGSFINSVKSTINEEQLVTFNVGIIKNY